MKALSWILALVGFFLMVKTDSWLWGVVAFLGVGILFYYWILNEKADNYFNSAEFRDAKDKVESLIQEHNEIRDYVDELNGAGTLDLWQSKTGEYSHLATFENTSKQGYKRDRNVAEYAPHVCNASLEVVRKASQEPIRYFCKYFDITPDKETLQAVEELGERISRIEAAIENLRLREGSLLEDMNPPGFIMKHFSARFWQALSVQLSDIRLEYQQYRIEYVSPGGNSGQSTQITLNIPTLEAIAEYLGERIQWAESVAGQRALMTAKLRGAIKERDGYECQLCGVSVADEPHLLLEVDHIIPVSRGGLSVPENLRTLCWRCNRSKGAKIEDKQV